MELELDKDPKDMEKSHIEKQYWEIQRLRENETNAELAVKMAERQNELWQYAKRKGFHKELI